MNAEELKKIFKESESQLRDLLLKAFYSNKSENQVRAIVYQDLEKIIAYLNTSSDTFVDSSVLDEFKGGAKSTIDDLLTAKFITDSSIAFEYITDFTKAPESMQNIVLRMIESYKASFGDTYKATRGTVRGSLNSILSLKSNISRASELLSPEIQSKAVDIVKAQALKDTFTGKSLDNVAKDVEKQLKQLVGRDFGIMFRDRAGRRWSFERYAEMMTREITSASYREGQREQFLNVGVDVVTTNFTDTTDSCLEWQGKLISLTGATPGIPTYDTIKNDESHMFKYGCRHQLVYLPQDEIEERMLNGDI